MNGLYVIDKPQ